VLKHPAHHDHLGLVHDRHDRHGLCLLYLLCPLVLGNLLGHE
jgi:hypothetical protein